MTMDRSMTQQGSSGMISFDMEATGWLMSQRDIRKIRRKSPPPKPTSSREGVFGRVNTPGGPSSAWMLPATYTRVVPVITAALALGLMVAVCYVPAMMAGFVRDDVMFVNAWQVQKLSGLWQIWFEPGSLHNDAHYWPISYTTFWLEHKLWGFAPTGYHSVNLLLHLGVTVLLWRLMLRLAVPGAWVVAAVFAVHPLHVESVTWVMGRKDLLSGLFYLTAALAYLRFVEDGRRGQYGWALLLFVLSLLSQSIGATLPVSLLIWHWWKQGHVTGADLVRVTPLALAGLGMTVADWMFSRSMQDVSLDYSLLERGLIAAHALWFYAGKLVWPTELAVIYPHWDIGATNPLAWGYVIATIAVVALLWVARHRVGRGALAGVLFFAVTLSPTLGFVDHGYMWVSFVAERYQYLAGIGVIALLVGAASHGASWLSDAWNIDLRLHDVVVVPLVILGGLTWLQSGIYRDDITLNRHVISINPEARTAHTNLGLEYNRQGRYEQALDACRIEYADAREYPADQFRNGWTLACLGEAAEGLGRFDDAGDYYQRAVQAGPRIPVFLDYLSTFWIKRQRYEEALDLFRTMIALKPRNARYHSSMGVAFFHLKRFNEALESVERALALDSSLEEARTYRRKLLKILKNQGN